MGGTKVYAFLVKECPNAFTKKNFRDVKGPVVIDTSQVLHMFGRVMSKNSKNRITTSKGEDKDHIYTMMTIVRICVENRILPINIFDGPSPSIKKDVVKKRIKDAYTAKEELEELLKKENITEEDEKRISRLRSRSYRLDKNKIDECCSFLSLLGLPYKVAPEEADPQCSMLERTKKFGIVGVAGEDSDLLAFGVNKILRNFKKDKEIVEIELSKVLEGLGLSYIHFVDIFVYSGVDYCKNLPGMNISIAYDIYKNLLKDKNVCNIKNVSDIPGFDNLPEKYRKLIDDPDYEMIFRSMLYINEFYKQIKISETYLESFIEARDRYVFTSEGYDPENMDISWKTPDIVKIRRLLLERYEFTKREVDNFIDALNSGYRMYNNPNPLKNTYNSFSSCSEKNRRVRKSSNPLNPMFRSYTHIRVATDS